MKLILTGLSYWFNCKEDGFEEPDCNADDSEELDYEVDGFEEHDCL